jgi:hypothetical protein
MASIHKEMLVDTALEEVWAAIRERIINLDDLAWRTSSMA